MFEIINPKSKKKGRQHEGDYIDHLPALRKIAPVTIIQHTPRPDEDGTDSYPIHIGTPGTQTRGRAKIARYCVIALALALLTTACNKTAANWNTAIVDLETGQYCEPSDPSEISDPSDKSYSSEKSDYFQDTIINIIEEWEACCRLAHAFAMVESNDNPRAVNHCENAVGLLQIRPIMVKQANQIVGEELYELSDREDSLVSIAIFHTVMSELNPSLDVDRAIDIWNPNATQSYRNLIKAIYHE